MGEWVAERERGGEMRKMETGSRSEEEREERERGSVATVML